VSPGRSGEVTNIPSSVVPNQKPGAFQPELTKFNDIKSPLNQLLVCIVNFATHMSEVQPSILAHSVEYKPKPGNTEEPVLLVKNGLILL
jgi:hypothetical protein